jgi:hypothetical protein
MIIVDSIRPTMISADWAGRLGMLRSAILKTTGLRQAMKSVVIRLTLMIARTTSRIVIIGMPKMLSTLNSLSG